MYQSQMDVTHKLHFDPTLFGHLDPFLSIHEHVMMTMVSKSFHSYKTKRNHSKDLETAWMVITQMNRNDTLQDPITIRSDMYYYKSRIESTLYHINDQQSCKHYTLNFAACTCFHAGVGAGSGVIMTACTAIILCLPLCFPPCVCCCCECCFSNETCLCNILCNVAHYTCNPQVALIGFLIGTCIGVSCGICCVYNERKADIITKRHKLKFINRLLLELHQIHVFMKLDELRKPMMEQFSRE